jgi:hypothetical protein
LSNGLTAEAPLGIVAHEPKVRTTISPGKKNPLKLFIFILFYVEIRNGIPASFSGKWRAR